MIRFADSINPAAISTADFDHVAAYVDGLYTWPDAELRRFPRHIEISVFPGDAQAAAQARVLDIERFDANPADFPLFVKARLAAGHEDATAYCSIDTVPAVIGAMRAAKIHPSLWRLWVAWWWGRPMPPTAGEVANEIAALTGVVLPAGLLWACQWQSTTKFDQSVLYQRDDFTKRS